MDSTPRIASKILGVSGRLVQQLGDPINPDKATSNRDRIGFARYLVEMKITGDFPDHIKFKNEHGVVITQPIHYEWQPVQCKTCGDIGHETDQCKSYAKPIQKKVWKPKSSATTSQQQMHTHQQQQPQQKESEDAEGFIQVKKRASTRKTCTNIPHQLETSNSFESIQPNVIDGKDDSNGDEKPDKPFTSTIDDGQYSHLECERP